MPISREVVATYPPLLDRGDLPSIVRPLGNFHDLPGRGILRKTGGVKRDRAWDDTPPTFTAATRELRRRRYESGRVQALEVMANTPHSQSGRRGELPHGRRPMRAQRFEETPSNRMVKGVNGGRKPTPSRQSKPDPLGYGFSSVTAPGTRPSSRFFSR